MFDAPLKNQVSKQVQPRRVPGAPALRRDGSLNTGRVVALGDSEDEVDGYVRSRRFSGLRFRLRGGVPRSITGKVAGSAALLACLAGFTAAIWHARTLLLHDDRLVIASSSAIQITGNNHLTRPQLLSVFGGDVDRNILTVSLAERKAELESLPWVKHATVMRLMPNRIRVAIEERTPVAFVRRGGQIGLVDASGVLLDLTPDAEADHHYSFPVVTGISPDDPDSTRAARMKLFERFTSDLDAGSTGGARLSNSLSEVDLSSPEDVKALIPSGSADVLVHFGDDEFLKRYTAFEKNLPAWKQTYPKLASVDMRYEHNVVLEMQPGAAVPVSGEEGHENDSDVEKVAKAAVVKPVVKPVVKAAAKPAKAPAAKASATGHLQTAFDVHAKPHPTQVAP